MRPTILDCTGPGPVMMNAAGTVCKGWSMAGGRACFSHPSELPHAVWLVDRIAREEDGTEDPFFQECTEHFPATKKIREPTQHTHKVVMVKTGPEMLGWPTTRPRSFTAALSKKRLHWTGPAPDEEIQREFNSLFSRSCALTGDIFSLAPEASILKEINRRLALRGLPPFQSLPGHMDLELLYETLPPGAKQRLEQYLEMMAETGIGGACLCDVEQWPKQGKASAGPYFPCQLTHGTVVSLTTFRSFLGSEHVAAQGFHMFPEIAKNNATVIAEVLQPFQDKDLKELSGNAMSLPAWAAWVAYVCSHTERVAEMKPIERLRCSKRDPAVRTWSSTPRRPWTTACSSRASSLRPKMSPKRSGEPELGFA